VAGDEGSPGSPRGRPAGTGGPDDTSRAAAAAGPAGEAGRAGEASPKGKAGSAAEPGRLLADLARLRRQARTARHGYWFPLVLFGLLTCGAAPLYVVAAAPHDLSGAYATGRGPLLLSGFLPGGDGFYIGWYWAAALVGGYLLTVVWYRWRARRAGLATPARSYLIIGVVLTALVLVIPPLTMAVPALSWVWMPFGDVWIRGTLAFLIIAIGLWVLARAERSRALAAIALVYTGAALLSSLYNVENIVFRLGWNPGRSAFAWQLTALPNVLLPAAILLAAGCGAFLAQRTGRSTA
jgi:hypothetical protein